MSNMIRNETLENILHGKKPFVYEIDGEYFILGQGVIRSCQERGQYYYPKYKEAVARWEKEGTDEALRNLCVNFNHMLSHATYCREDSEAMPKFINGLSESEKQELENQVVTMEKIHWLLYHEGLIC